MAECPQCETTRAKYRALEEAARRIFLICDDANNDSNHLDSAIREALYDPELGLAAVLDELSEDRVWAANNEGGE